MSETVKVRLTPTFLHTINPILQDSSDYQSVFEQLVESGEWTAKNFDPYMAELESVAKKIHGHRGYVFEFTREEAEALRKEAEYRIDWAGDEYYYTTGSEKSEWYRIMNSAKTAKFRIEEALA